MLRTLGASVSSVTLAVYWISLGPSPNRVRARGMFLGPSLWQGGEHVVAMLWNYRALVYIQLSKGELNHLARNLRSNRNILLSTLSECPVFARVLIIRVKGTYFRRPSCNFAELERLATDSRKRFPK
ncbi:uncharacterized protein EV420DRAFT_1529251 [Desarmillaria tabescens]|uniref:Uncharacterized protein n=1 Tax=Armillaria tabescens TaxID=1929756 RepID=A0AA39N8E5_ARMTA|nr:uncharacterized protein EV420DRAFT_1529251 [Desarmillaria tabescens]KAK0460936.1 hypothetical protein EV420DRAFT_1529251 [Desarmillaria tabescens]